MSCFTTFVNFKLSEAEDGDASNYCKFNLILDQGDSLAVEDP